MLQPLCLVTFQVRDQQVRTQPLFVLLPVFRGQESSSQTHLSRWPLVAKEPTTLMAHPYHHAVSTTRKWGGVPEDYVDIHSWFDESKKMFPSWQHRALRHHAEGIFMCEAIFGVTIKNSAGRVVPVRAIGEQHVKEDLGWIPTMQDWFRHLKHEPWMTRGVQKLSIEEPCGSEESKESSPE